ncbi:hypothetical protein BV22DRAFT_1190668 [Leucogyrophana mollusca]|uniref:Uncharacterized protein n=1 Tax=Leucogyrophana mollusca TaxID=85980 RepID=A0ACB8C0D7_9AGAM|nr:hypothetical protein BV22DRAFT_1190668 [Leucogyrophana mollusca]
MDSLFSDPIMTFLPTELAERIFILCVPSLDLPQTTSRAPVLLCLVSKSWRDYVYNIPALWRTICLHPTRNSKVGAMNTWLTRSGRNSLVVFLKVSRFFGSEGGVFVAALFAHSARIHTLRLCLESVSVWNCTPTLPRLERLEIEPSPSIGCAPAISPIVNSAPRLREIVWSSRDDPQPVLANGNQLRKLSLLSGIDDLSQVKTVLQACPHLTYLAIRDPSTWTRTTPSESVARIPLMDLATLEASPITLQLCVAPNLLSLAFTGNHSHIPSLLSFLPGSPRLRDLKLTLRLECEHQFMEIFNSVSSVVFLEVTIITTAPNHLDSIINNILKALARGMTCWEGNCVLPCLQHLIIHGHQLSTSDVVSIECDTLVDMLERRQYRLLNRHIPHDVNLSIQSLVHGIQPAARLKSFILNGYGALNHHALHRLEPLRNQGLALGGTLIPTNNCEA